MSKKFGKFLLFSAVAGASAYGAYHYLKTKDAVSAAGKTEDADDDFDDFSEDLDEDVEPTKTRSYVSLNLDKAEAIATEAFHKAKEVIVDSVNQVKETVKSVTENQINSESNFTDLTALNKEKESEEESDAKTEDFFDDDASSEDNAASDTFTTDDAAPKAADTSCKEAVDTVLAEESIPVNTAENVSAGKAPDEDKIPPAGKVEEFFDD